MKYSEDIIKLKGIGEKTANLFHRMGIFTVEDLIGLYPRDYQSYQSPVKLSEAGEGETVTVELEIPSSFKWKKAKTMTIGTGSGNDGTDQVSIIYFNMPYLRGKLVSGSRFLFRERSGWKTGNTIWISLRCLPMMSTGRKWDSFRPVIRLQRDFPTVW